MKTKSELQKAEFRRDVGIAQAEDHANGVDPSWSEDAYSILEQFCRQATAPFIIEEVRAFADGRGFFSPTDERAWGGVIRRAAAKGLIRKIGYAPAKSSNLSPKCLWEAV